MEKEKIFNLIRGIVGNTDTENFSDRTINGMIDKMSAMAPTENAESFWTAQAEFWKTTVAGQISYVVGKNDEKHRETQAALKAEKERLERELEEAKKGAPTLTSTPPATPPAYDLPEDVKKKLEEFENFKKLSEQEKLAEKAKQDALIRKQRIAELVKKPEHGLNHAPVLNTVMKYMDYGKEQTDEEYLAYIKNEYNETIKDYVQGGHVPFVSVGAGKSMTEDQEQKLIAESAEKFKKKFPNI